MLKPFTLTLLFFVGVQQGIAQSSAWRGYVTYFNAQNVYSTEPDLATCNYVRNGELRIQPTSTNRSLYWTNFEFNAPICLTDNFSYEVKFKNNSALNGFSAYDVALGLLTSNGSTGCTLMGDPIGQQWTNIVVADQALITDKPYLVLDMTDWVIIKLTFQNNVITYSKNDVPFFTAPYTGKICNLDGLSFRFKGSAAVDWIRITNNDDKSMIYSEDFQVCNNMSAPTSCTPSVNLTSNKPCEGDTLKLSTPNRATAYEWTGPNGFRSNAQNPVIPRTNRLNGGTYSLKAQLNACQTVTENIDVRVNLLPIVSLGNDTALCSGQSISLNAGNIGSTYKWQNGSSNRLLDATTTGNFSVTVTNTEGCKAMDTVKITVAASTITPTILVKKPTCYGKCDGEVSANAKGGFGAPFSYNWSGGRTTQTVVGRCSGDITITITDSKGCKIATVASVGQPPKVEATATPDTIYNGYSVRCPNSEDGQATVKPGGGVGNYTFVWQTNPLQTDRTAKGLKADTTYKVFVYDKNGCVDSTLVSLKAPPLLEADFSVKHVKCFGEKNGVVILDSIKGGVSPYTYTFNEKKYTIDSVRTYNNLAGGDYVFEIRDTNGCTIEKSLNIKNPPKLKIISTSDTMIHFGDDISLFAGVDTPSVLNSVLWKPLRDSMVGCKECRVTLSSPRVTTLYKLTVKDTFGCSASKDIIVRVDKQRKIFVPNAFSPNDDGQNDVFMIYAGSGTKRILNFTVFNRWGAQIYQAKDFSPNDNSKSWDGYFNGNEVANDAYIWFAEIEFEDGDREIFKGDIVVIK
jgi:gliding motility-associated-like protein